MNCARFLVVAAAMIAFGIDPAMGAPEGSDDRKIAVSKVVTEDFNFFFVPSSGFFSDKTFIVVSKLNGPSQMAVDLASAIVIADVDHKPLAVSGSSEAKTAQVIKDALKAAGRDLLPGLQLIYVGGESMGERLKIIVDGYGAKFTWVKFQTR